MSKVKPCRDKKTKKLNGNIYFHCPGCNKIHEVSTQHEWTPSQIIFAYNYDEAKPTITPTIEIHDGRYATKDPNQKFGEGGIVCVSKITEGHIRFLESSTHALRSKTVELPDLK